MKRTDFCSAVVKSRRTHFACMKPAVAVHASRGFCKEHAPAFKTFYVFRIGRDGSIEKVLVFQPPNITHSFNVVSPSDRKYGSTLWGSEWHRSVRAARLFPLKKAAERVREAKKDLADCIRDLKKIRAAR